MSIKERIHEHMNRPVDEGRRGVLRLGAALAVTSLLPLGIVACSTLPAEVTYIELADLDTPEKLQNLRLRLRKIHLTKVGEEIVRVPIMMPVIIGTQTHYRTDWITSQEEYFKMSRGDRTAPILLVSSGTTYWPVAPLVPPDAKVDVGVSYTIEGHVEQIRRDGNEGYVFMANAIVDESKQTPTDPTQ